ncbi:DNA ligase 1-like [Nylanderia fulva]|uniref:DNA ligase 1-like n=1 Tax=Nylanderia fulva TaxID=613905 RepID=UPI0010FB9DB8|nr:DNA ligase 1-like [Nylanderia fulva]
MKMHPTVNSDESVTADRSAHIVRYTDHPSRNPKEQIPSTKNAQTEYKVHLLQNAAHSSTYNSNTTPSDRHNAYRERRVNDIVENQLDVPKNAEQSEQEHKSVDTRDIDLLHRYRLKTCKLRLWCERLCRKKKEYSERVRKERTRWFLKLKERSREREQPDDVVAVAGVSGTPREPISRGTAPRKSKKGRKQDEAVEIADKDVFEKIREEIRRKERKERKKRERRKLEEQMRDFIVDTHLVTPDDRPEVPEDHVPGKPPSPFIDFTKTCCYLCAQNTLAIAAASAKPEQSDKCVQVSAHKFHAETPPTLDKSCSPTLLVVRTVQLSAKVRTRETSTLCPGRSLPRHGETEPRSKKPKNKFNVFSGLTRTKCPAGRHAACEIDKPAAAEREPRNEKCCREKNA